MRVDRESLWVQTKKNRGWHKRFSKPIGSRPLKNTTKIQKNESKKANKKSSKEKNQAISKFDATSQKH